MQSGRDFQAWPLDRTRKYPGENRRAGWIRPLFFRLAAGRRSPIDSRPAGGRGGGRAGDGGAFLALVPAALYHQPGFSFRTPRHLHLFSFAAVVVLFGLEHYRVIQGMIAGIFYTWLVIRQKSSEDASWRMALLTWGWGFMFWGRGSGIIGKTLVHGLIR